MLLSVGVWVASQSVARMNNFWDNTYYINPSSINDNYRGLFSLVARNQWLGFKGAPKTVFASGTLFVNRINTQFGLKFYADQIGYNTITNVSISYGYAVFLNREWTLNLGLAGSFQSLAYDQSAVNVMTQDDPLLYENLLHTYNYNCDVGAELLGNGWKLGVSGMNLFSLFFRQTVLLDNVNYAYAMYRIKTRHPVSFQLGGCLNQTKNMLQVETCITTNFEIDNDPDAIQASLLYRTRNEMGVIVGANLSETLHVAYSYDFNVSGISRYSTGSHELMLVYRMNKYDYKPYRYR